MNPVIVLYWVPSSDLFPPTHTSQTEFGYALHESWTFTLNKTAQRSNDAVTVKLLV